MIAGYSGLLDIMKIAADAIMTNTVNATEIMIAHRFRRTIPIARMHKTIPSGNPMKAKWWRYVVNPNV